MSWPWPFLVTLISDNSLAMFKQIPVLRFIGSGSYLIHIWQNNCWLMHNFFHGHLTEVKVIKGSRDLPRGVEKIATVHFLIPDILKKQNPTLTQFGHQNPTGAILWHSWLHYLGRSLHWTTLHQNLHSCCHPQRNYMCNVSNWNIQRFWFYRGLNFWFSYWFLHGP